MTSSLKKDEGVTSKCLVFQVWAIGISTPLQILLHFIFAMGVSFRQSIWSHFMLKHGNKKKGQIMATVTALDLSAQI